MSLRIAGYAALFDVPDADGDVILQGAFARSIADFGTEHRGKPVPLLWQHNPDQPLGLVEMLAEDARGLRVIARIDNGESRAALALERGEVNGLSFGYRARAFQWIPGGRPSQPGRQAARNRESQRRTSRRPAQCPDWPRWNRQHRGQADWLG